VPAEERRSVPVRMDERKRSAWEAGARGALGAGRLKVKVWTVEAGWRVDAMISTSRVKDS
jgi:hypothetical protein